MVFFTISAGIGGLCGFAVGVFYMGHKLTDAWSEVDKARAEIEATPVWRSCVDDPPDGTRSVVVRDPANNVWHVLYYSNGWLDWDDSDTLFIDDDDMWCEMPKRQQDFNGRKL